LKEMTASKKLLHALAEGS